MVAAKVKPYTQAGAIRKYLAPDLDLTTFRTQYSKLTAEDKLELAQGSARNLGLQPEQCNFPLSKE